MAKGFPVEHILWFEFFCWSVFSPLSRRFNLKKKKKSHFPNLQSSSLLILYSKYLMCCYAYLFFILEITFNDLFYEYPYIP